MAAYTPSSLLQQRSSGSSGLSRGIGPKTIEDDSEHEYLKDNKDSSFSNVSIVTGEAPRLILPSTMSHTRPAQVTSFTVTQESSLKGSPGGTQPHHYHQHQQHHHQQQQQQQQQQQHGVGDTSLTNGGGSKRKRFTAAEKMRILGHLEETSNLRATARRFGVDRKTIRSWMEHRDELRRMEEQSKEQEPGVPPQGMEDGLTPPSKRRRNLTPGEKLEIVQKTELGRTVRQVAKDYGVDPKSVRYWQRQKTELEDQLKGGVPKTVHVSAIPFQYQQNLGAWLQGEESRGSNITYAMIVDRLRDITKGTIYESFNPTDSWLMKFKKKYSIKSGDGGQAIAEQGRVQEQEQSPALQYASTSGLTSAPSEPQAQKSTINYVNTSQLKMVFVFNTLRELMNSKTEVGGVAMCEGNPKLFVKTAEGWLRAELEPACHPLGGMAHIDASSINVQLYKQEDKELIQKDTQ